MTQVPHPPLSLRKRRIPRQQAIPKPLFGQGEKQPPWIVVGLLWALDLLLIAIIILFDERVSTFLFGAP